MSKRVFIVHGWEGNSKESWLPWLQTKLEERDFSVRSLSMPNSASPTCDAWVDHLRESITLPDESTFLVGHSLGVITILRYLETLTPGERIGGAVLVAGFSLPIGFDELSSFFVQPLNYERVRSASKGFAAIHSDDDPFVPLAQGHVLRDKLGASLTVIHGAGHLNGESNYFSLPEALRAVLELAGESESIDTH